MFSRQNIFKHFIFKVDYIQLIELSSIAQTFGIKLTQSFAIHFIIIVLVRRRKKISRFKNYRITRGNRFISVTGLCSTYRSLSIEIRGCKN